MTADLRQPRHRGQEAIVEVPRMGAREADPLDAVDVVDRFEQPGEVARRLVGRLVVVHDLTEQLHFLAAGRGELAHLGQDVGPGTHPLVAARVRHHAEAAELVAPFDDRHIPLDPIVAPRDPERPRDVVVGIEIDRRRRLRLRLLDQHREPSDGLRPDDDVGDTGRPPEDRLPFLLRHAAGHRHDRPAAAVVRQLAQLAEARVQLPLRALPDAARVDDDDVGVAGVVGRLEAGLLEQTGHALRVVHVHLAAEGLDQIFARHVISAFGAAGPSGLRPLSLSPFRFRLSAPPRSTPVLSASHGRTGVDHR